MLENLIEDAMQWDDKESSSSTRKRSVETSGHIKNLIDAINNCGVSFSIWEKRMQIIKAVERGTGPVSRKMTEKRSY